jgi:hypothetical protein
MENTMAAPSDVTTPTRAYWIISSVALIWNLIGVMTYLMSVTMSPEALNAMPEAERALYTTIPAWATSAYAIAVFGGTLASVALLLRKAWATPVFVVSLVGILVQMGHALFMTEMLAVQGAASAILPALIVIVAASLVWFAKASRHKGWIS